MSDTWNLGTNFFIQESNRMCASELSLAISAVNLIVAKMILEIPPVFQEELSARNVQMSFIWHARLSVTAVLMV